MAAYTLWLRWIRGYRGKQNLYKWEPAFTVVAVKRSERDTLPRAVIEAWLRQSPYVRCWAGGTEDRAPTEEDWKKMRRESVRVLPSHKIPYEMRRKGASK